jgi:hypothetical protein
VTSFTITRDLVEQRSRAKVLPIDAHRDEQATA